MDKKPLIGVSICAAVLLVLGSLSNVVGYQTVQSSNQAVINNEVNQKELLIKTIVDIANNKEIQGIILKHQINSGEFPASDIPVLTIKQLKQMYIVGLMFSQTIGKSRMHSIVERYRGSNQVMQKEINAIIEMDTTLKTEITQLSDSRCDCENENIISWNFPVICILLIPILILAWVLFYPFGHGFLLIIMTTIGDALNCFWIR
jgi:hypothetical protein